MSRKIQTSSRTAIFGRPPIGRPPIGRPPFGRPPFGRDVGHDELSSLAELHGGLVVLRHDVEACPGIDVAQIDELVAHVESMLHGRDQREPLDDGRYRLANDHMLMELRVDRDGLGIVSGDVIAASDGRREFLFSFRNVPGQLVDDFRAIPIAAETANGARSTGRLSLQSTGSAGALASFQLEVALARIPAGHELSLTGRYEGEAMRVIGLETTAEVDTDLGPVWVQGGVEHTIESTFARAGVDLVSSGHVDRIPSPRGGKWHDSQLHDLMIAHADASTSGPGWNLQLLMFKESVASRLLGVMFDSGSLDTNSLPRQGAAVFQTPIDARPDAKRKLIQTTAHELGHALNLAHRFERQVGRADSTSIMNYDWRFRGGNQQRRFWREFDFAFDDDELAFLCHGPLPALVPGGAEFHTIPYWENSDGAYSPYRPEVRGEGLELSLEPPPRGAAFDFGQPVTLTAKLTNRTGRTIQLPWYFLDPKQGMLELVIQRDGGGGHSRATGEMLQGDSFHPFVHRCFDMAADPRAADLVRRGHSISNNVNLTFGSGGFSFPEPGGYRVQAVLAIPWGDDDIVFHSPVLRLWVNRPYSREDELDAIELFDPAIARFLALGGSHALDEAGDRLAALVERREYRLGKTDAIVGYGHRCAGLHAYRHGISYRDGRHRTIGNKPERAVAELEAALAAADVFDPYTADGLAALATKAKAS